MDESLWSQVWTQLNTPTAYWLYSWFGVTTALLIGIALGLVLLGVIREFDEAVLVRTYPGFQPSKPASVAKRIAEMEAHDGSAVRTISLYATGLILLGLILPAGLLLILLGYHDWFVPGSSPISSDDGAVRVSDLDPAELTVFLLDQTFRGGLSDTFEVFGIALTDLTNNPDNRVFSAFFLSYRILAGAVTVAILILGWRLAKGIKRLKDAIGDVGADAGT
ncbi:hypothetical protein V0U79_13565 [Hyphobacterium sp. HN65]|uniref:Uncharacterized protein n=1 Tax=Hyphobacterium lacteum TaxID=3116575 RepID=A0ABU7LU04_9PROT|nr:hypothetical protein [Hyphobacterium sp. HN65]MEE2527389.1 hypothetical protein [Hyphobacterium sp. HN65]